MAQESIGTARIDIEIDNSKVEPGVNAAKQSVASLATEVEKGSARQVVATSRQVTALERNIATLGKSREEVIRWRIEQQTTGKVQDQLKAKLDASVAAMKAGDAQLVNYGMSAKATAAAMRGVPAQITDIAVSLQGGQRPLTVLLQQGGQLKDMFGGVVPAARALGSSLMALVNPYSVAAAAVGVLALAWYSAQKDAEAYTKALVLTGYQAGATEGQLASTSANIANSLNITAGAAREATLQVINTGGITRDNMELVARAAAAMQQLTGASLDQTVSAYARLADEPVAAVLKLNESSNFLTLSLYDQVRALQEQGNYQAAATVATKAASEATVEALNRVRESQNWLSKSMDETTIKANKMWAALKNSVGLSSRGDEMQALLRDNRQAVFEMEQAKSAGGNFNTINSYRIRIETNAKKIKEIAAQMTAEASEARIKSAQSAAVTTAAALDKIIDDGATKEEKKRRAIAKVETESNIAIEKAKAAGLVSAVAGLEERKQKAIEAIREKYKEKPKGGSTAGASRTAGLQGYKDDLVEEKASIAASTKTLQAEFQARQITAEAYYGRMRELSQQGTAAEAASLEKQIAFLRTQSSTGREGITVGRQIGQLEAQLAKVRLEGAASLQALATQERAAAAARSEALVSYQAALDASTRALRQQMAAMVDRVGAGEREYQIQQRVNEVYREQAERLTELALKKASDAANASLYDEEIAKVRAATDERVRVIRDGYADMAAAQSDWLNGASAAWADYRDEAANTAGMTQNLMVNAFTGAEDAAVRFAKTGKFSFSDMADSIIADLTRIAAKQAIVAGIQAIGQAFGPQITGFAKGGAMVSPSLSAYSGGVYDKPQMFAFAKGAGVFGEAGPEAIMPLRRTSDGRLGVAATGGGGAASFQFNTEFNIASDGSSNTQSNGNGPASGEDVRRSFTGMANAWATDQMRPGGVFHRMRTGG